MKKGILLVDQQQQKFNCKIVYNKQSFKLIERLLINKSGIPALKNKEVDFEMDRGKIIKVMHSGIIHYEIPKAHAPYNFIPLNENVNFISPELLQNNSYYSEKGGYYNGYIEISATNPTPIFVRGTLATDSITQSTYTTQKGDKVNIQNYSPAGIHGIPGSSVRGMIRTLIEIVSFGKFGFFNDDSLYFRSFGDVSLSLRDEYNSCMSPDANFVSSGLVFKEGRRYKIIPNGTFSQIPIVYKPKQSFDRGSAGNYTIYSGFITGKNHDWRIVCGENKSIAKYIPESDIENYENDINRSGDSINILKETLTNNFVPCFYYTWDDDEESHFIIGHTRFFRIPNQNSISGCIHDDLLDKSTNDLVNSMFGDLKHPGKLFFEDLVMTHGVEDLESVPKILSTPKPTSFQLYLEQGDNDIEQLNNYNSDEAIIRGNKLYWHKSENADWKAEGNQPDLINSVKNHTNKQRTIIKPIKKDAQFSGKIRFENLSEIELGALLFSLKLKDESCHKIGMGKPLGLGSIKITPTLHLIDRFKRYQSLLDQWHNLGVAVNSVSIDDLLKKFMDAVWTVVDKKFVGKDLWDHPRLKQLEVMLDFVNKPSDGKTTYMELGDFKHRMVLPTPEEVIKQ